jgi:hypothetical protein
MTSTLVMKIHYVSAFLFLIFLNLEVKCQKLSLSEPDTLLNDLHYPSALDLEGDNLFITEAAGRNTSFGGNMSLLRYSISDNRLVQKFPNPPATDAISVIGHKAYMATYKEMIPGNEGTVFMLDMEEAGAYILSDVETAATCMCKTDGKLFVGGLSDPDNTKSLFVFEPNETREYSDYRVLLGDYPFNTEAITCNDEFILFSDGFQIVTVLNNENYDLYGGLQVKNVSSLDFYKNTSVIYSSYKDKTIGYFTLKKGKGIKLFRTDQTIGAVKVDSMNNYLYALTYGTEANKYQDGKLLRFKINSK